MQNSTITSDIKIAIVGPSNVGKKTFTSTASKKVRIGKEYYDLSFEPLGVKNNEHLGRISDFDGFIFLFGIDDKSSFDELLEMYKLLISLFEYKNFPHLLVGNKCDLESKRQVQIVQGLREADQMGVSYFETSCKTELGITEAVEEIVRRVLKYKRDLLIRELKKECNSKRSGLFVSTESSQEDDYLEMLSLREKMSSRFRNNK